MNYEIWKYGQGFNKVCVEDINIKEEILSLKGCRLHCTYYKNRRLEAWDIVYPVSQDTRIMKILKKSDKRKHKKIND